MKNRILLIIGLTLFLTACEQSDITIETPAEVSQEQVQEILIDASQEQAKSSNSETGIYFTMGYNKQVLIISRRGYNTESIRIAFTGIDDSRCPVNAKCITQGAAKVQLSFTEESGASETVPMCIGDCYELDRPFDNEAKLRLEDELVFELNNAYFALVLKDVTPDLMAGFPTLESDYAVEMQIIAL
ncbi:hypothetical protein N7U66_11105 [Lacinutrix neustonica]|uniref:Lipoprotein n=1 Tax=Lacinutrix neustonica TaxID=2980107 RepID=A0A9E8MV34_9FLAO|nr:hypothetical protein [Lacinutrix neustonica]WAC00824.1 hypothetical protein N7U66_11105 [Lacinutrix neustonica]